MYNKVKLRLKGIKAYCKYFPEEAHTSVENPKQTTIDTGQDKSCPIKSKTILSDDLSVNCIIDSGEKHSAPSEKEPLSKYQIKILKRSFGKWPYLTSVELQNLSVVTLLSKFKINKWFHNKRFKLGINKNTLKNKKIQSILFNFSGVKMTGPGKSKSPKKSIQQINVLKESFGNWPYLQAAELQRLSVVTSLSKTVIGNWFINTRCKLHVNYDTLKKKTTQKKLANYTGVNMSDMNKSKLYPKGSIKFPNHSNKNYQCDKSKISKKLLRNEEQATDLQTEILLETFNSNPFYDQDKSQCQNLASALDMSVDKVNKWFNNERKLKEIEIQKRTLEGEPKTVKFQSARVMIMLSKALLPAKLS